MVDTTEREVSLLRRLELLAEKDPQFSDEEVKLIREAIKAFEGLRAFGRGTRLIVVTLGFMAAFIASWDTVTGKVRVWLIGQ